MVIFNCIVGDSPFLSVRSIGGSAAFKCVAIKKSSIDIIAGFVTFIQVRDFFGTRQSPRRFSLVVRA